MSPVSGVTGVNPATPVALRAMAATSTSGLKPSPLGAGFIKTMGRKASTQTSSAMTMPMTEALARLAAFAAMTGL
ncbi:hypothetical protein D3C73_1487550 [compost metagenome]